MFSFENGPYVETVSNASAFLGDSHNIWDHIVSEEGGLLLNGFTAESTDFSGYSLNIRSCLMFLILLSKSFLSRNDLGWVDQTMNDSAFYVMCVVGHEVQITTSMRRFSV
jgi:hypothetical protein